MTILHRLRIKFWRNRFWQPALSRFRFFFSFALNLLTNKQRSRWDPLQRIELGTMWFLGQISTLQSLITLSENEKNVTSISIQAYAHVFNRPLSPFPNKPWFLRVYSTSLLKTLWEKEKLLVTSNFSFFHSVFYPLRELSVIFISVWNCHLPTLSVWKSLKCVVWEWVNMAWDFMVKSWPVIVLATQRKNAIENIVGEGKLCW